MEGPYDLFACFVLTTVCTKYFVLWFKVCGIFSIHSYALALLAAESVKITRLRKGSLAVINQIYLVMFRPTQLRQASLLQKNQMLQNVFFDICNAEMAQ